MVTYKEYREEKENLERLKSRVDRISSEIKSGRVKSWEELGARIEEARRLCEELFPDKLELFDMVYKSRLQRLWEQFRGP